MPKAGDLLLDTNAAIALLNRSPGFERVLASAAKTHLPLQVVGELFFGACASSRADANIERLERLLSALPILPQDAETARLYGGIRSRLKASGRPIPENDIWIAASALQHNLRLVTKDEHFAAVDGLVVLGW